MKYPFQICQFWLFLIKKHRVYPFQICQFFLFFCKKTNVKILKLRGEGLKRVGELSVLYPDTCKYSHTHFSHSPINHTTHTNRNGRLSIFERGYFCRLGDGFFRKPCLKVFFQTTYYDSYIVHVHIYINHESVHAPRTWKYINDLPVACFFNIIASISVLSTSENWSNPSGWASSWIISEII